jgi:hypothetical protein
MLQCCNGCSVKQEVVNYNITTCAKAMQYVRDRNATVYKIAVILGDGGINMVSRRL